MKKINLIIAALCGLAACTPKSETEPVAQNPDSLVNLEIVIPEIEKTKAAIDNDATVNSIQILVFRESGVLEVGSYTNAVNSVVKVSQGVKDVAVIVNHPKITESITYESLQNKLVMLDDFTPNSIVMYGTKQINVTLDARVEIDVARLVARIEITSVKNDITLEQYKDLPVAVTGISLINVVGSRTFGGVAPEPVWYNKGINENHLPALLSDSSVSYSVPNQNSHRIDKVYYCFPNSETDTSVLPWTPRSTRLVVQAKIGEKTCYYSITIPNIVANKRYVISSLNITRLGSDSPDMPLTIYPITFNVVVKDWDDYVMPEVII